ncbi:MAG: hypothetical protein ACYTG1_04330 [Planctomycetota bacterium]|jgi:MYXO-CTERM domain-containing protein
MSTMHRRGLAAAALAGVAVTTPAAEAAIDDAIIVSLSPSEAVVEVSDTFTVDVIASIAKEQAIVTWGMDVHWDGTVLAHDPSLDVDLGRRWWTAPTLDGDGLSGLAVPPQTVSGDSILLATLTFTAVAPGVTPLAASRTDDDPLEVFAQSGGGTVPVQFADSSVTVLQGHVAPMPPAALLGAAGLGAVALIRRRRGAR